MFAKFLLSFIPVFVAVDAIGTLPLFVSLTEGLTEKKKTKVIIQSVITAAGVAIGFIFVGKLVFRFLGITMGDFMIAGGVILFCLAIIDIVNPRQRRRVRGEELGAVPLGTPLIAGPALLTTSLLIIPQYGWIPTLLSVLTNILLAGLIFKTSAILIRVLGEAGSKAISKIMSLLLGAIAVMLIRKGLVEMLGGGS